MITGKDIYEVLAAIVPLYVAMILAYGSVRWWRVFTPDQCSGINRFVAAFAVPLLSFHFISANDPYAMNYRFIAADSLQKVAILLALFLWNALSRRHAASLDWTITLFSLSSLPNTLVMGIPLLRAMYGDFAAPLMVQIVVLQSVVWYTLMLFLFEYRGAKALIAEQFPPEIARSIASIRVDSDVVSLSGREPLQLDPEVGQDGKLHVVVRSAASSIRGRSMSSSHNMPHSPRASSLTGVEIYSVQSSPRASSFNQAEFYAMFSSKVTSPRAEAGRSKSFQEETGPRIGRHKGAGSKSSDFVNGTGAPPHTTSSYPAPNPVFTAMHNPISKDLHMYVWSSSASPGSEPNLRNAAVNKAVPIDFGLHGTRSENAIPTRKGGVDEDQLEIEDALMMMRPIPAIGSPFLAQKKVAGAEDGAGGIVEGNHQMPPASVVTRLILIMVWRKLIRNPNTYSSLLGLVWSLLSFRLGIKMPKIVQGSISILSDAGLGMAMFSLGLFMALQPKMIACGKLVATFAMAVRFLTGPAVIAATSIAIGIRGVLLQVAIVQAALPQGIVPFVFAKEYNCHPDILSTAVIFGMLIALPITILYYILLGV